MLYCSENYKYDCIIRINNKTILSIATKQSRSSISKEMVNIILLMTNEFNMTKNYLLDIYQHLSKKYGMVLMN